MPYVKDAGSGQITKYMDKAFQTRLAKKHGLNTAQSWIVELDDCPINVPKNIVYPCFCKPLISTTGYKSEIKKCRNKNELYNWLELLQKRNKSKTKSILVQQFLDIEEEYSISAVCNNQEVIIPCLLKKIWVSQAKRGVTLCGVTESIENIKFIDNILALVKSLHYIGMIDIEIFKTGDGIYFNELNFRSSGVIYAVTKVGVNLPTLLVDILAKGISKNSCDIDYEKAFFNDRVAWDDYIYGFISKRKFKELESLSDFSLILTEDDPEPGRLFLEAMREKEQSGKRRVKFIKQIIKKCLGRL